MNKFSKIISFLPSATEILFEIGLGDYVFGVTHECNYPTEVMKRPKVIRPIIDFNLLSAVEVDSKIKELSAKRLPIFKIDEKLIKEIQPDLLLSQDLCSVCAPFDNEIKKTFEILGYRPENLVINPKNLRDILESVTFIGTEIGNLECAVELRNNLTNRITNINEVIQSLFLNDINNIPERVICLDWINPFYLAGHWIPDMLLTAGSYPLNGFSGMTSREISLREIEKLNPDKIIIAPCGYDLKRAHEEYVYLTDPTWKALKAYKENQIYLVDSDSYFSKPSSRIITGIEILCHILHPDLFSHIKVPDNSFVKHSV